MAGGRLVLAQVMDFFPHREFDRIVANYRGNKNVRRFSCYDQFMAMAFAQLTFRESLRDIQACLMSFRSKLYHAGLRGSVARSTPADANESRDWRIYADLAQALIGTARALYADGDCGVPIKETVYAFDSTTIDLCLSLFPWARFRKRKGAIKLHTLLDLRGPIPCFVWITDGKVNDILGLDLLEQHLRIKAFNGNSLNAVKTQVWIAVCTNLMILILKKRLRIERSLAEILQILSLSLFDKSPIYEVLTESPAENIDAPCCNP